MSFYRRVCCSFCGVFHEIITSFLWRLFFVGLLCVVVQVAGAHVFVCMRLFDGDFAAEKCAGCKDVFVVWLFNKSIFIVDIF